MLFPQSVIEQVMDGFSTQSNTTGGGDSLHKVDGNQNETPDTTIVVDKNDDPLDQKNLTVGGKDYAGNTVLVNDLERPVFEKHLFLAEVKRWLMGRPGVRGAMMSGSGSTMFAVVEDEGTGRALMEDAARELDPTLWMWSGLVMQDDAR